MTSQLKILLGGFGDIARRVVTQPALSGASFTAVRRTPVEAQGNIEGNINVQAGDLRDIDFLAGLLAQPFDVLVLSITPDSFSDQGYQQNYVAVAEALKEALTTSTLQPGLILWVSSTSVYGDYQGGWVDEDSPAQPGSFSGKRLLEAEQIIQSLPVSSSIVRFSGIYGPGRNRLINQVKAGKVAAAEPVSWTNRIHSEDCAGVLAHLIQLHRSGRVLDNIYLATDCQPVPSHQVQSWIAEQLGIEVGEAEQAKQRASRRCDNKQLLATGYEFNYPDYRAGYGELLLGGND